MGKTRAIRLSSDKADNSTDVASSYVRGERIKKMLKAASYEDSKGGIVVNLSRITMDLELACYHVDLLNRSNTIKAYELALKEGVSKLNLSKINKSY